MTILLKNCAIYGNDPADILVEDGRIAGIGSYEAADEVHDMTGYAHVLPGVIDSHIHIVTGPIEYNDISLKSWARSGVTTVRDLGLGNDIHEHPTEEFLAYRDTVETPECAHCLTCGRFVTEFGGSNHIMPDAETGLGCKTVQDCIDAVNHQIDIGCDGIKTIMERGQMGPPKPVLTVEKLRAIAETAQSRGVWCTAHVLDAEFVPALLDAGIPAFAHMPTNRISDDLIDRMVAQGVSVVPTLCTVNPPPPSAEEMAAFMPKEPGMKLPPMPEPAVSKEEQEKSCIDNVRRFFARGGLVALGTDTMRMETRPGSAVMPVKELQLLHAAGLSVSDVIDAATINAAKVCMIDDQVGSIEVGKLANIIAVKEKIDKTFEALGHVEFVMNRGVVIRGA